MSKTVVVTIATDENGTTVTHAPSEITGWDLLHAMAALFGACATLRATDDAETRQALLQWLTAAVMDPDTDYRQSKIN